MEGDTFLRSFYYVVFLFCLVSTSSFVGKVYSVVNLKTVRFPMMF
jgi:hypothetical protein